MEDWNTRRREIRRRDDEEGGLGGGGGRNASSDDKPETLFKRIPPPFSSLRKAFLHTAKQRRVGEASRIVAATSSSPTFPSITPLSPSRKLKKIFVLKNQKIGRLRFTERERAAALPGLMEKRRSSFLGKRASDRVFSFLPTYNYKNVLYNELYGTF